MKNLLRFSPLAVLLASCLPVVTGAPCSSNDNCPSGQVCVERTCAVGTSTGGGEGGGNGTGGGTGGGVTGGGGGTGGAVGGGVGGGGGAAGGGVGGGAAGGGTGGGSVTGDGGAVLPQVYEVNSAGARMTGGTITLDVEVGLSTPRTKMMGGTLEVTGSAAVQR